MDYNDSKLNYPGIDLERSELRYIFYSHNQDDLIKDLFDLGFEERKYEETPITQTLYFASRIGLKPGLSVKARAYKKESKENYWRMDGKSVFNLLEIKSSLSQEDFFFHGLVEKEKNVSDQYIFQQTTPALRDLLFRIQRASEDGLLRDSTLKTKSRVKKVDITTNDLQSTLTLKEILQIMTETSLHDEYLSSDLKSLLNNKVRPLFSSKIIPFVMTQYKRRHFIPKDEGLRKIMRITIDPGVEYYIIKVNNTSDFLNDPLLIGEYLTRERFCRLEFKVDPKKLTGEKGLERKLSDLLRRYGCIAYISKKWTGATLVSERYIEKQSFWREPLNKQISGYFPVDPTWFKYGQVTEELFRIIELSPSFKKYEKTPQILIKNENFVRGYIGVPIPSLVVNIEGPKVSYSPPSKAHIVKMIKNQPEFYVTEENISPVRSIIVSSKEELDQVLHPSIKIEGYIYFRSYGFLVIHTSSNRVYKLTIERKSEFKGDQIPISEIYCKLRYIGNKIGLSKINKYDIYEELQNFYEELYPIMESISSELSGDYVSTYHDQINNLD